jgi:hypothetical protein
MNKSLKALLILFVFLTVIVPIANVFYPFGIFVESFWRGIVTGLVVALVITSINKC